MALHLRGVVLPEGERRDVFVTDDKRITFEPIAGARTILEGGFLIPGLVDCHCHLAIASPAPAGSTDKEQVEASAHAELAAGVLALREPGSPNRLSRGLGPEEGLPRVVTAGIFLAPPGRYFPGLSREVSRDELVGAAVEEAKRSGGWTKLVGDYPVGRRFEPNFSPPALQSVADAVHAVGGRLAIHALLPEVIEAAIEAGFDSIEHGMLMTPDLIDLMASRGTTWCPTLAISGQPVRDFMEGMGIEARQIAEFANVLPKLPSLAALAVERGVRVVAGTDAGMIPHGQIAFEVELLASGGMSTHSALGAASWHARLFLGLPGIEEGAPADIVAYAVDPRDDLAALRRPLLRVLDGRQM